jgi:Flp pilus assembly protein TadG
MFEQSKVKSGVFRHIRRFRSDNKGVAAIEFALIVPIMLGLYIMLNETAAGLRAARKVTMTARVASDLTTQLTNVANKERDEIFDFATPVMSPYSSALTSIRITSIRFDNNGKGYVDWSEARGTELSAHPRCMTTDPTTPPHSFGLIAVPAGLRVAGSSVVLAEVSYDYKPVIGYNITGTIKLKDQLFTRPRAGTNVTRTGSPTAPCAT